MTLRVFLPSSTCHLTSVTVGVCVFTSSVFLRTSFFLIFRVFWPIVILADQKPEEVSHSVCGLKIQLRF